MQSTDKKDKKTVFVNGIFDILHPGHIQLFRYAKSLGGKLIVGINSDRATKILKGKERPINNQEDRKLILKSLGFIDEVIIFDDVRTGRIIRKLKPDIVVRGNEYTVEHIRREDKIPSEVEINLFPMIGNFSTTNTIANVIKKVRRKK